MASADIEHLTREQLLARLELLQSNDAANVRRQVELIQDQLHALKLSQTALVTRFDTLLTLTATVGLLNERVTQLENQDRERQGGAKMLDALHKWVGWVSAGLIGLVSFAFWKGTEL